MNELYNHILNELKKLKREDIIAEAGKLLVESGSPLTLYFPRGACGEVLRRRARVVEGDYYMNGPATAAIWMSIVDNNIVDEMLEHFGIEPGYVPAAPLVRDALASVVNARVHLKPAGLRVEDVLKAAEGFESVEEVFKLPLERLEHMAAVLAARDEADVEAHAG